MKENLNLRRIDEEHRRLLEDQGVDSRRPTGEVYITYIIVNSVACRRKWGDDIWLRLSDIDVQRVGLVGLVLVRTVTAHRERR